MNRNIKIENKKNYKFSIFIVLSIILVFAMLTQLTFLSIFGTKGSDVSDIRKKQKDLILQSEIYSAEISKLQSLQRIKEVASDELGMVEAEKLEYISSPDTLGSNQ